PANAWLRQGPEGHHGQSEETPVLDHPQGTEHVQQNSSACVREAGCIAGHLEQAGENPSVHGFAEVAGLLRRTRASRQGVNGMTQHESGASVRPADGAPLSAWLSYLESIHHRPIELGLDRVREVADRMGLLKPECLSIVVAGTNGKGSTCAMLEAVY